MDEHPSFDHELERAVRELGIPPCPEILLALAAEAGKLEPDMLRIERLISADVGLSAALIRTVNSPFYGLRAKVHSIMQGMHIVGLSRLSLIVTGMVMRDLLKDIGRHDMERFWDASTKMAVIASYIAGRLPYIAYETMPRKIDKDEAYTYGLFQDCGIPLMMYKYAGYKDVLGVANHSVDRKFTAIEQEAYGQDHAQVGYYLARSWGLPEVMYKAIRHHHEHAALQRDVDALPPESRDLIGLALLAERAIQLITGFSHSCEWEKGGAWVLQHFGLSEVELEKIVQGIRILYEEGNLDV